MAMKEEGGPLRPNDQEITRPIKSQDKIKRPSEMPKTSGEPSAFQPPGKPGYDVLGDAILIKEVGDMSDSAYPGKLNGTALGADLSPEATNRVGGFGSQTDSDAARASLFEHPYRADKPVGSPETTDVQSMPLKGCGSDDAFDRFPDRQRSNAPMDADDR